MGGVCDNACAAHRSQKCVAVRIPGGLLISSSHVEHSIFTILSPAAFGCLFSCPSTCTLPLQCACAVSSACMYVYAHAHGVLLAPSASQPKCW